MKTPDLVPNWINGTEAISGEEGSFNKFSPATGSVFCVATRSQSSDVGHAVRSAQSAQKTWAAVPPVQRGLSLLKLVNLMNERSDWLAEIVAQETGKTLAEAKGEVAGAAQCGLFYASEGQRLFGKTLPSGASGKSAFTVYQAIGVAGLIIAANTPVANVAWKIFPALICGNAAVLKASEDAPLTAWAMGLLAKEAGLPDGVLNILQGLGSEAGEALVSHPDVGVVSFTGSTRVGLHIQEIVGKRLARISLELGGKNPLVVCDDADLEKAIKWVLLSAFSNAGQRCAAGSRIIIFDSIYDSFVQALVVATEKLKVGSRDGCDLGPVINERQLNSMLGAIESARQSGARILVGGQRAQVVGEENGYYMQPTLLDGLPMSAEICRRELFGPIATLHRVSNFAHALELANDCDYGLTACIHTKDFNRAMQFCEQVEAGMVVVNGGTFGSEPHMPFGGRKLSGNGSREPGTEALQVYAELKNICLNVGGAS